MRLALSFDDVLLVPKYSELESRGNVDLSTNLGSLKLRVPFLAAPMDTICESEMAIAIGKFGGAGVLHRFASFDPDIVYWADQCKKFKVPIIISIGVNNIDDDIKRIDFIREKIGLNAVCIDVAHGDHVKVIDAVNQLRVSFPDLNIMAGSIATAKGAYRLLEAGANILRVGIGGGSVCSTRIVSGHGVPTLQSVLDVIDGLRELGVKRKLFSIICDGGVRRSDDVVKAIVAGADACMFGSVLAGTDECPGDILLDGNNKYKVYRGMASYAVQKEKRPDRKPKVEGISAKVPYRGPVAPILDDLEAGVRSGFSYSGSANILELREKAEFIQVTANGVIENHPHNKWRS